MSRPRTVSRRPRVDPVRAALARLAEAQEETQGELRALAQAQRRTEERVDRLEAAVERLAEAQRRTEERIEQLALAVQTLAQQVGRLGDTIGYGIEDLARDLTPDRLARRYGITVLSLDRAFFRVDGQEIELDFYGLAQRDGEHLAVVGEAKSRIYGRDVEALSERARQLAAQLPGTPLPVLFGFVIHPSAREAAARLGAIVIASGG
jgi:chaperonin cofactor prefoldin